MKPTQEQLENLKLKEGYMLISGDQVFHTIQGEGDMIGVPCTFIRLHHCNLNCSWCDSKYTWDRSLPEFYEEPVQVRTEDIIQLIENAQQDKGVEEFIPEVVITGGEPLIQQDEIVRLIELNPHIHFQIETNGTIMPNEQLLDLALNGRVKFNCSPKLPNANMRLSRVSKPDVISAINSIPSTVFKFVCMSEQDIDDIEHIFTPHVDKNKIMIMPEGITTEANEDNLKRLVSIIIRKGYRITPRLQNNLFGGGRRV